MERKSMAPTLRDGWMSDLGGPRSAAFFDRAGRLIDWGRLTAALAGLTPPQPQGGRPFWPLPVMLKCQLLQNGSACRTRGWRRCSATACASAVSWA